MLLQAIGAVLPAALAVALSPFAPAWVAGLAIVATLAVVVFGGADDPDSPSSAIADGDHPATPRRVLCARNPRCKNAADALVAISRLREGDGSPWLSVGRDEYGRGFHP